MQLQLHASDLRVKGTRKGLQNLPPLLKKAVDAKLYHGCPCTEGQRGLVCDTVKRESGFQRRLEDVEDARAISYLPRRTGSQVWNQPKREKCIAVNQAKRSWSCEQLFGIRHGDVEFEVYPLGKWTTLSVMMD